MRIHLFFSCLILINVFNFLHVLLDGNLYASITSGIIHLIACIFISVFWVKTAQLERR